MDSIYIVSKNKANDSLRLFHNIIDLILKRRLLICHTEYFEGTELPIVRVQSNSIFTSESGEEEYPMIQHYFFEYAIPFKKDNVFPIILENDEYYPVLSLKCRDALFLLDYSVSIIQLSQVFRVCNVENKLMSLDELLESQRLKDYSWAYRE